MRSFCSSKTFVFRVANGECCLRSCCRCVRVRVAFSCGTSSSISIILCVCACGSVHILDRKKFFSCGTSSIFHHFAPVGMAPCVFWIVVSLFCRLHFQSSCVSAFIILRERIVVFSCSPLRFLPLCVCVPVTWYAINLKLDAFVDMGSRLGSTKHVLVSVVVQMTDNLVISLACCPEFTIITWFRPFNGELLGRPILRVCFFVPFWGQKGDPLFWPCFQFLEPKPPRLASRLASRCCVPMMKPL